MSRTIEDGDTWVGRNPVTGRNGVVYLKEVLVEHPTKAKFRTQVWHWESWFSDGSGLESDWAPYYGIAVEEFKQSLGSGADQVRMRYDPSLKFGRKPDENS